MGEEEGINEHVLPCYLSTTFTSLNRNKTVILDHNKGAEVIQLAQVQDETVIMEPLSLSTSQAHHTHGFTFTVPLSSGSVPTSKLLMNSI